MMVFSPALFLTLLLDTSWWWALWIGYLLVFLLLHWLGTKNQPPKE
jgi:hypothetical protein